MATIESVRNFWDRNPLFAGEAAGEVGTRSWFETMDRIKVQDVYCGDLVAWIPEDLAGKRVLDVGCGPGFWSRAFGAKGIEYIGIDLSEKSVELARTSLCMFGYPGEVRIGNAEALDFPDATFDYIISEGVIHHTPDTAACVREIFRVLRPGGRASISVYYRNALLRSRFLFRCMLVLMRSLRISMPGRGREEMLRVTSPDELVRMYDGRDNPIGRCYTAAEFRSLMSPFGKAQLHRYYLPFRTFPVRMPLALRRRLASWWGLMICAQVVKEA